MNRLNDYYEKLNSMIAFELLRLSEKEYNFNIDEVEFIYNDPEYDNESYAIDSIYIVNDTWVAEYEETIIIFTNLPIKLQCDILDYIKENYENNNSN